MKVLMLTWEFPPMITGGLGMACYGIAKALLKIGTTIYLVLPAKEVIYFDLQKEQDADALSVCSLDKEREKRLKKTAISELLGLRGPFVSVYYTRALAGRPKRAVGYLQKIDNINLFEILESREIVFQQVKSYTDMAVEIARELDFDVIHAHDWLTYPAGIMIKNLSGRPLVCHIHATEFDRAGGAGNDKIHKAEYAGLRSADRVIAVSSYTAGVISEKYCIEPEKIAVIHNAYTVGGIKEKRRRIFKEPTILFMGRITLQKGPDYFLEVARKVVSREKRVKFIMAGRGDMERSILHRAAYLGMGTNFLFAGFLNRAEVEEILSSTDIFVMPSVSEPFGIVPLEAMSFGAVAVVPKQSGVAEVIENAFKVDFWDTDKISDIIVDLIQNPAKLREMSQRGMEEVSKLQWEAVARNIIDVYEGLAEVAVCST